MLYQSGFPKTTNATRCIEVTFKKKTNAFRYIDLTFESNLGWLCLQVFKKNK